MDGNQLESPLWLRPRRNPATLPDVALTPAATSQGLKPSTPVPATPGLTRELESAFEGGTDDDGITMTARTRKRVADGLRAAAEEREHADAERLRRRAVEELVSSEKSYLRHLQIVEEFFMKPLSGGQGGQVGGKPADAPLMPQREFAVVFGDLPAILKVNRELLARLEASLESDKIGQVFRKLAPFMKFYSTYANDFEEAVRIVEKRSAESAAFRNFLSAQESRPEVAMRLNSLLITPIQRVPRYKLLLDDVIRRTPEGHPDKSDLRAALEQIEGVAHHINEELRERQNATRMLDLQNRLVGGQPEILAPGRRLLKEGRLMKVARAPGGHGQPRYFALFTDMIMYCKYVRRRGGCSSTFLPSSSSSGGPMLECGCVMPLKTTKAEPVVGQGVFKLSCQDQELLLYSGEGGSTQEWVDAINGATRRSKLNSATLRKESSRRTPLRRPNIMKLRRDSLCQIMADRIAKGQSKAMKLLLTPILKGQGQHAMNLRSDGGGVSCSSSNVAKGAGSKLGSVLAGERTPRSATKRRAEVVSTGSSSSATPVLRPSKVAKRAVSVAEPSVAAFSFGSPLSKTQSLKSGGGLGHFRGASSSSASTATWRWSTLSLLARKDKLKGEEKKTTAVFSSPSIFGHDPEEGESEDDDIVASYLAGKMCPLTPSQAPTDVKHLAVNMASSPGSKVLNKDRQRDVSDSSDPDDAKPNNGHPASYCSMM